VSHFETSALETALDVETLVDLGAIKDTLKRISKRIIRER